MTHSAEQSPSGYATLARMPFEMGHLTVREISDGSIALDGGAMFGVVPRPLWEKHLAPDARNRVHLALRCMLVVDGKRRILVDDGAGARWDGKSRDLYGIQHGHGIDDDLAKAGLKREDITDVVLTHLHFDHAGGTVRQSGEQLSLSFPQATYHLQRRHWKWAHDPAEKDRHSFRPEDFRPLENSGQLHLIEGSTELYPGITLFVSEGHTVGLQLVRLEAGGRTVVFCGDLIPTTAHLRPAWVAAYDLYPLTTIEEKKQLLAQAVEEGWYLFLEHDPSVALCSVIDNGRGQIVVDQVVPL